MQPFSVFYFGSSILNFQELQIFLFFFIVVCLFETEANLSLPWQSSCLSLLSTGITAGITMPTVLCLWCLESPWRWKLFFKRLPPSFSCINLFLLTGALYRNKLGSCCTITKPYDKNLSVSPTLNYTKRHPWGDMLTSGECSCPVALKYNDSEITHSFLIEKRTSKQAILNLLRADLSL